MLLVYDTLSGNTRRFAQQLAAVTGLNALPLSEYTGGAYLLLTYTFGKGEVPITTSTFLSLHAKDACGVVSSGSYHWGQNFGKAGKTISEVWGIPLVGIINKSGTKADIEHIRMWLN